MKLYFVTGNENKLTEVQKIVNGAIEIEQIDLDLDEIQAVQGADVIRHKAEQAYALSQKPVLIEDTSLYFNAWNNLPGALTKWFLKTVASEGICKMMQGESNRSAFAETIFATYDGQKLETFSGKVEGIITESPRGENGFGWDNIFQPNGSTKTFAEMTDGEKNEFSMRKLALSKVIEFYK